MLSRVVQPIGIAAALLATGCEENPGFDPPSQRFFFPQGLALDPRRPEGEPSRYLFVSNGNNDRRFNAGSVVTIDVDRFLAAWAVDSVEDLTAFPYCERDAQGVVVGRCVKDPGFAVTEDQPCRRLATKPNVIECDEVPFAVGEPARIGNFATVMAVSHGVEQAEPRLWVPVRGEPSITYFDIGGDYPETPNLDCGQGQDGRCDGRHRLTNVRNDDSLDGLSREPFTIEIDETDQYRYAYIGHSAGGPFTLIDLDGVVLASGERTGEPAIVDIISDLFTASGELTGGYGVAPRPCNVEDENVPAITQNCSQPLVYSAFRFAERLTSFTVQVLTPEGDGTELGPYCATPEELGLPGAISCDPLVVPQGQLFPGTVDLTSTSTAARLAEIAFADELGDTLMVLQTNPGALLRYDTSLDARDEPSNLPGGVPLELCEQPTRMELWRERGLAFVTCFPRAEVMAIDLRGWRVIGVERIGTGPNELVLDPDREMLYVVNTLEASVSLIHVDDQSPTFLQEIARIGLQEPFSQ